MRLRRPGDEARPLAIELFTLGEPFWLELVCPSQADVDHCWSRLVDGGEAGPCGWLKDRFGVSWQIVPCRAAELLRDSDVERSRRVERAMLKMSKLDVAALEAAAAAPA